MKKDIEDEIYEFSSAIHSKAPSNERAYPDLLKKFDRVKGLTQQYENSKKIKQLDLRKKGDIGFRTPNDKGFGYDYSRLKKHRLDMLELKKYLNIDLS